MNTKTLLISILLISFAKFSYSANHYLYYLLHGYTGNKALLFNIKGSKSSVIDSTFKQSTGAFVFENIEKYPAGMYRVYFNDSIYTEVIFNDEDINLESDVRNIISEMKVKKSTENAILFDYWNFAISTQDSITRLSYEKNKIEKTTYNSNHPRILEINKRIMALNLDLRHYVINKSKEFPDAFAPKLLKSYLYTDFEEYKNQHPENQYSEESLFYFDHYFDNIDFSDSRFLNTKVLYVTISDYMKTFAEPATTNNYKAIIDQVMNKASANKEVFMYCLDLFMITFESSIWDDVTSYLIDKYYVPSNYYPPQMNEYYSNLSNRLKSIKPGKEAPDIILADLNGNTQNMKSIKAKAKLIVFYSSDCSHCQEALPGLIDIYNMYRDKGLEGFGIALDDNEKKWKAEVKKFNLNWINLSDLKGLISPLIQEYNLSTTPTIFILDANNIIISKPKDIAEVHASLLQILND